MTEWMERKGGRKVGRKKGDKEKEDKMGEEREKLRLNLKKG